MSFTQRKSCSSPGSRAGWRAHRQFHLAQLQIRRAGGRPVLSWHPNPRPSSAILEQDRGDDRNSQVVGEIEQMPRLPPSRALRRGEQRGLPSRAGSGRAAGIGHTTRYRWHRVRPAPAGLQPSCIRASRRRHTHCCRCANARRRTRALRVAPEAELRRQPSRRSIVQADTSLQSISPAKASPLGISSYPAEPAGSGAAGAKPSTDQGSMTRAAAAPPARVARPEKPGLKLGKLPQA